jgi:hypothetical protein
MEVHHGSRSYLLAYMAGLTIPAVLLIGAMFAYVWLRLIWDLPMPLERVIAFPMAIIPNAWGLWNMIYIASHLDRRVPIGWYGAMLPVVLMPIGWRLARTADVETPPVMFGCAVVVVAALYYVLWRYAVAALNRLVGVQSEAKPHAV